MTRLRTASLFAGGGVLVVAVSPGVERLAHASLTGHMVQHLLVGLVAPPLLVLAAPTAALLRNLPRGLRRPVTGLHRRLRPARRLARNPLWPLAAAGLHTTGTWGWHVPAAYDAAMRSPLLHVAMHLTLLGTGLLLWSAVVSSGRRSAFGHGTGIVVVFVAALQHAALASLLMFAPAPLYGQATGLDDQRLAALVMGVPAKVLYGAAVVVLVFAWLASAERRAAPRGRLSAVTGGARGRR